MIIDRLDKCPFCDTKLSKLDDRLICKNKNNHINYELWAWYGFHDNDRSKINYLNVRCGKYQIHWQFGNNSTKLLRVLDAQRGCVDAGAELNFLLDFELTKEAIESKIKMLKTFV